LPDAFCLDQTGVGLELAASWRLRNASATAYPFLPCDTVARRFAPAVVNVESTAIREAEGGITSTLPNWSARSSDVGEVAMSDQDRTARLLRGSLDIRHHVSGFDALAYELNLVSLNAQVAAVRIGNAGEAFRVLTEETSRISLTLNRLVQQIRELTGRWTALTARTLRNGRQVELLRLAPAYRREGQSALLIAMETRLTAAIAESEDENSRFIQAIAAIAEEMNKSLRVINYVTSGILIESSRLTGNSLEMETLQHIAGKVQSTAESIRGTATLIVSALGDLSRK
jgi:hypothetical protein